MHGPGTLAGVMRQPVQASRALEQVLADPRWTNSLKQSIVSAEAACEILHKASPRKRHGPRCERYPDPDRRPVTRQKRAFPAVRDGYLCKLVIAHRIGPGRRDAGRTSRLLLAAHVAVLHGCAGVVDDHKWRTDQDVPRYRD